MCNLYVGAAATPGSDNTTMHKANRVIVIGGGITGLSAAHRLIELGAGSGAPPEVLLLEAGTRLGGTIETIVKDGCILEQGPDSFITVKPAMLEMCGRIGLGEQIIPTNESRRRSFVVRNGELLPIPEGFMFLAPTQLWPFISSRVFSWTGKLRMLLDLVIPGKSGGGDESLASFVRRRFGTEALERIVQPLISGIYAADPERLSMRMSLPRFQQMEERHGSIIRAMLREKGSANNPGDTSGARYGLMVSLEHGMQSVVDALVERIPSTAIMLGTRVTSIARSGAGWSVLTQGGGSFEARGVIVATPSHVASGLVSGLDPALSEELRGIEYASSAVVNLVFRCGDIGHELDGFGFVVPAGEKSCISACSFSSVKFPNRAPEGRALLRCFVGGVLDPEAYLLDDEQMTGAVREYLGKLLDIRSAPVLTMVRRYPLAMPQYPVGHSDLVASIEGRVSAQPGLRLAGNAYAGIGTPDCVRSGESAAEAVLSELA